jgi:hypothetical protein
VTTPTQRTLKYLKDEGYTTAIVEKWNSHVKIRQDLFGIFDVLAMKEGSLVGVQISSYGSHAEHYTKLTVTKRDNTLCWLRTGNQIWLMSWRQLVNPGKKRKIWTPRIQQITLEELTNENHSQP